MATKVLNFWLAAFITVFCAPPGNAMSSLQLELVRPPSRLYEMIGGYWAINISGEIPADADKRFIQFVESSGAPDRIEVYLDSPGGSVVGGIALGRELRARRMNTSVGKMVRGGETEPGICYSACTLAYLGGYFRYLDERSEFRVHRFYFQNPSPHDADIAQMLSASIANYIHDMGGDIAFMKLSAETAGTDLQIVPHNVLRNLRVVNGGYTREEWSMQGMEGLLYVRGEPRHLFWTPGDFTISRSE
jgi:hypothetical protein